MVLADLQLVDCDHLALSGEQLFSQFTRLQVRFCGALKVLRASMPATSVLADALCCRGVASPQAVSSS